MTLLASPSARKSVGGAEGVTPQDIIGHVDDGVFVVVAGHGIVDLVFAADTQCVGADDTERGTCGNRQFSVVIRSAAVGFVDGANAHRARRLGCR